MMALLQPALHRDHRHLDQIGRGTLHRRINGCTLSPLPPRAVAAFDFRQPQTTAKDGFHIAAGARLFAGGAHVFGHPRIARKITVHILLRRRALDTQLSGQPERRHAVDQAKVDDLGIAALFVIHRIELGAKNLRCRRTVNIFTRRKGFQQAGVARDMRHDPEFDLRIVSRHDMAARRRDKRLADAPPLGVTYRNVLQVGIVAGQPAGDRHRLRVVGMHASGVRIDHARQLVGIG